MVFSMVLASNVDDFSSHFAVAFLDGFVEGFGVVLDHLPVFGGGIFGYFVGLFEKCETPRKS